MTPEFSARLESLSFLVPPRCQGQTVEAAYAADPEGLVRRIYDRSDMTTRYSVAPWPADDAFAFEPQNAEPEVDDWQSVDETPACPFCETIDCGDCRNC